MLAALILVAAVQLAPAIEATTALGREKAAAAGRLAATAEGASGPGVYEPAARAVANWRGETLRALAPAPLAALVWLGPGEARAATRCVRLNNYWCIKRARWPGEVGADEEGHTAFASAEAGADAAAMLLRRYYLDHGRRSALDIVRRWAPAECGPPTLALPPAAPLPATLRTPTLAGSPAPGAMPLTTRGLGRTLRARYLAARGRAVRRAVAAQGSAARSSAPARRLRAHAGRAAPAAAPLPAIAAGLPELAAGRVMPSVAVTASLAPLSAPLLAVPLLAAPARSCAEEDARQRNYAARAVLGLGVGPSDDLKLFAPDGRPLANLAPVLAAMSAFELGSLRASGALVARAVARVTTRIDPAAAPPKP